MLDWRDHIHSDPKVLLGKPTIKGTRLSVELILELLAQGWTNEMLLKSYPTLKPNHLTAVFLYLGDYLKQNNFTDLSEDELRKLKLVIVRFHTENSIKLANEVWDEKGFTDEEMDGLLKD